MSKKYSPMQESNRRLPEWYNLKRLASVEAFHLNTSKALYDSSKTYTSPSGRWSVETIPYKITENGWNYCKGIIRDSNKDNKIVGELYRNYGYFPIGWAESHENGNDYLITGEDYQGFCVVNLNESKKHSYISSQAKAGGGFCSAVYTPSPRKKKIALDGCYWGGPYEMHIHDFSNPFKMKLTPDVILNPENFLVKKGGSFYQEEDEWSFDSWETEDILIFKTEAEVVEEKDGSYYRTELMFMDFDSYEDYEKKYNEHISNENVFKRTRLWVYSLNEKASHLIDEDHAKVLKYC